MLCLVLHRLVKNVEEQARLAKEDGVSSSKAGPAEEGRKDEILTGVNNGEHEMNEASHELLTARFGLRLRGFTPRRKGETRGAEQLYEHVGQQGSMSMCICMIPDCSARL